MIERDVLDALHAKFCTPDRHGGRRYVVAEHCGILPATPKRILDFVVLDTWGSTGYALDGFEIKVKRADLQRELADPSKAESFLAHLDTFTLVLADDIVFDDLAIPAPYGIMLCSPGGELRHKRRPKRLRPKATHADAAPIDRGTMAAFARASAKTAIRVCSKEVALAEAPVRTGLLSRLLG